MVEPIRLSPEEYWHLRALAREVDALEGEQAQFVLRHSERMRRACCARDAFAKSLMDKYGFDVAHYVLNDESLSLMPAVDAS